MTDPLSGAELGRRLSEVFTLVGPLYRRASATVADNEHIERTPTGVRAVLELLDSAGPTTVAHMARTLELSRQFVQRSTDDALAGHLVRARQNPAHQRSPLIELTAAGRRRIATITRRECAVLARTGGDITGTEIDACLKVLANLIEVLS